MSLTFIVALHPPTSIGITLIAKLAATTRKAASKFDTTARYDAVRARFVDQREPSRFKRPMGQQRGAADATPTLAPTARPDYELAVGLIIGRPNVQGEPIAIADPEDHRFGVTLFDDCNARGTKAWVYQPLGPFQSKNFASTLSWQTRINAQRNGN